MNCKVRADLPTPPLPTMMTLWRPVCFSFAFDIVFVDAKCEFDETEPNTSDKKSYKPLPTEASSRKRDRCLGWTFLWRHRRQRMRIDEWGSTWRNPTQINTRARKLSLGVTDKTIFPLFISFLFFFVFLFIMGIFKEQVLSGGQPVLCMWSVLSISSKEITLRAKPSLMTLYYTIFQKSRN